MRKTQTVETYNGWKNRETWNVALWISNDEGLYQTAKECGNYGAFVEYMREAATCAIRYETPDGVSWKDSGLDVDALDSMIGEL